MNNSVLVNLDLLFKGLPVVIYSRVEWVPRRNVMGTNTGEYWYSLESVNGGATTEIRILEGQRVWVDKATGTCEVQAAPDSTGTRNPIHVTLYIPMLREMRYQAPIEGQRLPAMMVGERLRRVMDALENDATLSRADRDAVVGALMTDYPEFFAKKLVTYVMRINLEFEVSPCETQDLGLGMLRTAVSGVFNTATVDGLKEKFPGLKDIVLSPVKVAEEVGHAPGDE